MENTNPFTPAADSASVPTPEPMGGDAPAISRSFTHGDSKPSEPEQQSPEGFASAEAMPNMAPAPEVPVPPAPRPVMDNWVPPQPVVAGVVETPPQVPQNPLATSSPSDEIAPIAVVQVLSTRGVEYTMMMLCLWLAAAAMIWVLLALLNGGNHFDIMAFPVSLLVVSVPIFGWFFLRLKKAELANPSLKLDPSKRRLTQFTQVIAFAACLFNLIAFVYLLFTKLAGHTAPSIGKDVLNLVIILAVAGGVLAYYWNDEHRGK